MFNLKYYKNLLIVALIALVTGCSPMLSDYKKESSNDAKNNFNITSKFYNSMISCDKPDIAKLTLFFTKMPKGGDLHHHYPGTIYAETFLDWVKKKNWFIDECTLKIVKHGKKRGNCKLLTVPQLLSDNLLYRKLLTLWSDKDFYNHYHNQPPPDTNFFNTFGYFGPVSKKYMHLGLNIIKQRAIKENVSYIESMLSRVWVNSGDYFTVEERSKFNGMLRNAKTQQEVNKILYRITTILLKNKKFNDDIDKFLGNVKNAHKGIDDDNFFMRYQTYAVRVFEPIEVFTELLAGYQAVKRSPLFVGVNIVAPENNRVALEDYTLHMRMFNYLLNKYPSVRRDLHAGELTLGMVRPKDLTFHIKEARDIAEAERIGHAVDLPYEQDSVKLLEDLKNNSVIEINLTSNEFILGVKGNSHPYLIYSSYGVPIVISTDDSGVSRNNLSNEYVLLASRYKPTYGKIKEYVYNSIKYSFMDTSDKIRIKNILDKKFLIFEAEMAKLYFKFK